MFRDHLFRSSWIKMILHHFVCKDFTPTENCLMILHGGSLHVRAGSRYGLDNSSWHWWVASPSRCCRIFTVMSATRCSSWHGYGGFPKLCKLSSWHPGRWESPKLPFQCAVALKAESDSCWHVLRASDGSFHCFMFRKLSLCSFVSFFSSSLKFSTSCTSWSGIGINVSFKLVLIFVLHFISFGTGSLPCDEPHIV